LPRRRPTAASLVLAAGLGLSGAALAQDTGTLASEAADTRPPREPLPLWEVGAVVIAAYQPAYPGSDQNLARGRILPFGIYRGSVLHADGGGIGLRALRTPRWEWDASGSAAFGSSANKVKARAGMPSIGTLVEIGPAVTINLGDVLGSGKDLRATRLELPLRAVFDVNDHLHHKGWTFEPRLSHVAWADRQTSLVLSAGLLVGDRRLNGLYYGVDAPYATADRPQYGAKAGLVATRLNAGLRQRVTSSVRLMYFAQLETVRGAANEASPLVRSRQDAGVGVSLIWGAWQSSQAGVE